MQHIAIIGMGVAGVGVLNAYQALLSPEQLTEMTFHLFDTKESFGRGLPFRDPSKEALLNSKTEALSVHTQNMRDETYSFKYWLSKHQETMSTYEPRYVFGSYMKEYLHNLLNKVSTVNYYNKVLHIKKIIASGNWS